jgi:hypothetical protein
MRQVIGHREGARILQFIVALLLYCYFGYLIDLLFRWLAYAQI